jgi:hypothetical protein
MNGVEINVDTLLFGNDFVSDETNCEIFVQSMQIDLELIFYFLCFLNIFKLFESTNKQNVEVEFALVHLSARIWQ